MRFEKASDLQRERKAIEKFTSKFNGTYKKLDPNDIHYLSLHVKLSSCATRG